MYDTTQIKAVLKRFVNSIHVIVDALTVGLGINSTESIMKMNMPIIKNIKK